MLFTFAVKLAIIHIIVYRNDWDMPGEGGGKLAPSKVDGYFQGWIDARKNNTDKHGHIVLEHELNNATVKMTEKWLPTLQKEFNVVTIQQCMNVTHPYWEQNWDYSQGAVQNITAPASNASTTTTISLNVPAAATASASVSATDSSNVPSSATPVALNAQDNTSSSANSLTLNIATLSGFVFIYAAYFI